MTEPRACPECGAEVPSGRLSCGACGALLASVEGRAAVVAPTVQPAPASGDAAAPADPPGQMEAPVPDPAEVRPAVPSSSPPGTQDEIVPPLPPMPPIPGGYLPPSAVMRSAPIVAPPSAQTQPASWSASRASAPAPALPPSPRGPEPGAPPPVAPARAPVLELPFSIAPGAGPRLVAVGAALAVVAFVLPWIPGGGIVIGGSFGSGYFATWGLAAIGNVLPFLLAWASLVLAVLPNRMPRLAALGVLPLFLGGLLAGFCWTYLIAPYGLGLGIWALAVSALLLAVGGSLVLRGARSAG